MCSGAFHSFQAANAELSINLIIMVKPLNSHWERDMIQDPVWSIADKAVEYRTGVLPAGLAMRAH